MIRCIGTWSAQQTFLSVFVSVLCWNRSCTLVGVQFSAKCSVFVEKRKLAPSCQMLMGMPCPWPFAAWLSLPPPAFPPHLPSSATTDGPHAAQCVHSLGSFCHLCVHRDLLTFVKHLRTWLKNMKWPQNIVIEYPYEDIFLHNYVL